MVKVKICGLMKPADVLAVNAADADFAGFVFAPSRHQVSLETALALKMLLMPGIKAVGVFVNESADDILAAYKAGAIDIAQLHGKSMPTEITRLQQAGLQVIQVFERQSIDLTSTADYLMVDSGKGSGRLLNLKAIPHIDRPLILAGGLTSENIAQAVQIVRPDIVDVSSGVETAGHKDASKITRFIKKVKEEILL
ncbi:phosphoribosylanthranilate isomerase [Lactobacillus helveticus]|jgi:phosphoribosylanthranilate isomerase|uniref:N-(5'-phosphoribosyl)anthranilate isomerase n=1 Tax=Lactobacillus helveticus TaxID=1587 RepID=A0A3Q8SQ73_LACHE|nr:phosphoribosylanthranilate isomerase [Lactobacillus helveticus]AFR22922.1 N-(5'-phosphoribosyl)anthranilate isomerase [Lactobacillus helveticus R0052]AZK91609.1 N-(5'-phosphoribosyl)anthranilate isomerase [Lactobacillus helveticus]MCJ2190116.1 phosphoribosylanthranilate isomerase [Lactobacillus helveticus]MCS8612182.1 phosphoribosylanthranilate isomerase [Lactobacillus helveticus]MCT3410564.1 phosphoribosylanthranilate isomerase [Lactobacillus helveticus]